MAFTEEHGLFQFDFSDEDFATEDRSLRIPSLEQQKLRYRAREEFDGWFTKNVSEPMSTTIENWNGVSRIKMSIEHHYLYHRYEEALRLVLELIANIEEYQKLEDAKNLSLKEIFEIAIKCAEKCGQKDIAMEYADKLHSNDPGVLLAKARAYSFGGRFSDAIHYYILYNEQRNLDYNAWKQMGSTFMSAHYHNASTAESTNSPLFIHFAHLCFLRSLMIMTGPPWPSYNYAERRFLLERETIEKLILDTELEGGNAQSLFSLMGEKEEITLDGFQWEDIKWILMECRRGRDFVSEIKEEKSTMDL